MYAQVFSWSLLIANTGGFRSKKGEAETLSASPESLLLGKIGPITDVAIVYPPFAPSEQTFRLALSDIQLLKCNSYTLLEYQSSGAVVNTFLEECLAYSLKAY